MRSYQHLLMSVFVGIVCCLYFESVDGMLISITSAVFFGFFIDIDHILVSRLYYGDWRNIQTITRNPVKVYLGKKDVDWFPVWIRYISHTALILALGMVYIFNNSVYLFVGLISMIAHLASEPAYDYFMRGGFY